MNKNDLMWIVARDAGIRKDQAQKAMMAVLDGIATALVARERVILAGFGTFHVYQNGGGSIHNIATGQMVKMPRRMNTRFKPSAQLRKKVNGEIYLPKKQYVRKV